MNSVGFTVSAFVNGIDTIVGGESFTFFYFYKDNSDKICYKILRGKIDVPSELVEEGLFHFTYHLRGIEASEYDWNAPSEVTGSCGLFDAMIIDGSTIGDPYSNSDDFGTFGNLSTFITSHLEGSNNVASLNAHVEGANNKATGIGSHAEGYMTEASGPFSHAEGEDAIATGQVSHVEGFQVKTTGNYSHVEGYGNVSTTNVEHVEGYFNTANGLFSHVEGHSNTEEGELNHMEGFGNTLNGRHTHIEGGSNTANGNLHHISGQYNSVSGHRNTVHGLDNEVTGSCQFVAGQFAKGDAAQSVIIGGGTSSTDRKNVFTIDTSGNVKGNSLEVNSTISGEKIKATTINGADAELIAEAGRIADNYVYTFNNYKTNMSLVNIISATYTCEDGALCYTPLGVDPQILRFFPKKVSLNDFPYFKIEYKIVGIEHNAVESKLYYSKNSERWLENKTKKFYAIADGIWHTYTC